MKNILIIGASGHSKMIIDIIHKNKSYNIIGFVDSNKEIDKIVYGYKILGKIKDILELKKTHNIFAAAIAVGDNFNRKLIKDTIDNLSVNIKFVPIIHPSAIIANDILIPDGTVVMAGVIINADAKIGKFCILNSKTSLGHDSKMGDYSSLASGATIGGNVNIGNLSGISLNASVIQNINIGNNTIIGAGSLVLKSIGDYKVAYGVPINIIRDRKADTKYLS